MLNRRDFLTRTAVAGVGLTLGLPAFARNASAFALTADALATGTHLTPILLVEDALRLSLVNPSISADLKAAMIAHRAFMSASGALPGRERDVTALLATLRDGWAGRDRRKVENHTVNGDMFEPKLAFAAGWLAQRAALSALYGDQDPGLDDRAVYHDVTLLRAMHQSEPVASEATASVEELTQLFQMMYLRAYIRMHTIDPDFDDPEGWILRVVKRNRALDSLAQRYAAAYLQPDVDKLHRYVEAPNFYDVSDPLIQLARTLHQGITESAIDLDEAVAASSSQSQYARALGHAYQALASVSAFHEGALGEADLQTSLRLD